MPRKRRYRFVGWQAPSKPKRHPHIQQVRKKKMTVLCILGCIAAVFFLFGFLGGRISGMRVAKQYLAELDETKTALQQTEDALLEAQSVPQEVPVVQQEIFYPWNLMLINAEHPLDDDYSVPEQTVLTSGHSIDARAYPALQDMMDGARAAGLEPLICSSFRTQEKQQELFEAKVQYYMDQGQDRAQAEESATYWVQRPGTSEHQMALAVDIVDSSYQLLDEAQEQTPVQIWLMEHCAEYGFILRYPTDKSHITGVGYEPWHYRYVGIEAAQEIMGQGICLEEYLYPDQYE